MYIKVSADEQRLDVDKINRYLCDHSMWAKGISKPIVATSIEHSICIAAYCDEELMAFCRIINDYAIFSNLVDVIVWPEYQRRGIAV